MGRSLRDTHSSKFGSVHPQRTASVWRRSRWRVKLRCNYPEATELLDFSSVSILTACDKSDKVNSDPLCNGQGYLGFAPRAPCSRRVRIQSFVPVGQDALSLCGDFGRDGT